MTWDTQTLRRFAPAAARPVERAFRTLLEDKHLYQSVEISRADLSGTIEELARKRYELEGQVMPSPGGSLRSPPQSWEDIVRECTDQADACLRRSPYFMATDEAAKRLVWSGISYEDVIVIAVPMVKTYCTHRECAGMWPHNWCPASWCPVPSAISGADLQQVFVLRYECQNCRGEPVTFLVQRDGLRLTLSGRAPIEEIEIPGYIPKQVRKFYRGAVLAFNCGANLPSLFMLRTTIEQHMRHAIGAGDTRLSGDELADAYAHTLDGDFRWSQSLKPVYSALSEAIHAARDNDAQLFETERQKVLAHFEAKEVFERLAARR